MKKILIIEDRKPRQEIQFGTENIKRLCELGNVDNMINKNQSFSSNLNKENLSCLDEYDLLIFHRSFLVDKELINPIQEYAKNKNKDLILFSGGISQSLYTKNGNSFMLVVNSKDFYSYRLINFLTKYSEGEINNLLWLLYGDNYKLPYLLQYRSIKWQGKETEEKIDEIQQVIGKGLSDSDLNKEIQEIYNTF